MKVMTATKKVMINAGGGGVKVEMKASWVLESTTDSDEEIVKEIYTSLSPAGWRNLLQSEDEESWGMLDYIDPNRPQEGENQEGWRAR